jgi:hypothetical protein
MLARAFALDYPTRPVHLISSSVSTYVAARVIGRGGPTLPAA